MVVGSGDGYGDGGDDYPAHAVDEGEEEEHGDYGVAVAVLAVLLLFEGFSEHWGGW